MDGPQGGRIFPFLGDRGWSNLWQTLFINPKMRRKRRRLFREKASAVQRKIKLAKDT